MSWDLSPSSGYRNESSLIDRLTTAYGTSRFVFGENGNSRYLQATDPLGYTERLEYVQGIPDIPNSEPAAVVPQGMPIFLDNTYINARNTYYWDKHAYQVAPGDYTKARIRHWNHSVNTTQTGRTIESVKTPLENRVWMTYPGQSYGSVVEGTFDSPNAIGRVLDDGSSQITLYEYNSLGNITRLVDPIGREQLFEYAPNGIDVLTVKQKTESSKFSTIAELTYGDNHLALTYVDAAGQTTKFGYNAFGQLKETTNALGETTQYQYDGLGYLTAIVNANEKIQATFTYDENGRLETAIDSEGYMISYAYDALDRVTQEMFPDNTTRKYVYTNLDLTSVTDRQGNSSRYAYDAVRNLMQRYGSPESRHTAMDIGRMRSFRCLTDPNGNVTMWNIDLQNRVSGKQYADSTRITYQYENTTSRLKSLTDALGQIKQFAYSLDDAVTGLSYINPINPTPNVRFSYDPHFRQLTSMMDGNGTRAFSYARVGDSGALGLVKEAGPFSNDSISYQYDRLSRLSARIVDSSTETFTYDKLSRLVRHDSALGGFNFTYLGQTSQIVSQQSDSGVVGTVWTYESNTGDRRLKALTNSGATRSFMYSTTPESLISQIQDEPHRRARGLQKPGLTAMMTRTACRRHAPKVAPID